MRHRPYIAAHEGMNAFNHHSLSQTVREPAVESRYSRQETRPRLTIVSAASLSIRLTKDGSLLPVLLSLRSDLACRNHVFGHVVPEYWSRSLRCGTKHMLWLQVYNGE